MIDVPTFVLALFATASVASAVSIKWESSGWRKLFDRLIGCLERLERRRAEGDADWWKE